MNARMVPATDEKFFDATRPWFADFGEVFVRFTLSNAGGAGGCYFCETLESLKALVSALPHATRISVFRGKRLPFRGVVDNEFSQKVLDEMADGVEFLIVRLEPQPFSICLTDHTCSSPDELREWLEYLRGELVAVGQEPHFYCEGNESVITAMKDGIIGAY